MRCKRGDDRQRREVIGVTGLVGVLRSVRLNIFQYIYLNILSHYKLFRPFSHGKF